MIFSHFNDQMNFAGEGEDQWPSLPIAAACA